MSDTRYQWDPSVACQHVGGTSFVYIDRKLVSLNPVGSVLWERCAEGADLGELVEAVCEEFEVDKGQAAEDVLEFMKTLVGRGLIREGV